MRRVQAAAEATFGFGHLWPHLWRTRFSSPITPRTLRTVTPPLPIGAPVSTESGSPMTIRTPVLHTPGFAATSAPAPAAAAVRPGVHSTRRLHPRSASPGV